ncbi:hypothetical protein [Pseudonocardia alni]|uniref:hypothetical protein n=1 Tax=Pseudonocardia alni TaxID=33907 RepID=UPI0033277F79
MLVVQDWGLTVVRVGLLGSPAPIGMLVGAVLVGPLTDLLGRRRPVLAGVAVLSPAMVRCGPAPGVALLAGLAGRRSALPEGQGDDPAEHGVAAPAVPGRL